MMKTNIKPLLAIMVCVLIVYSACRKVDNAPVSSQPTNTDVLGGQIAVHLAQSLAGNFGGVNLMDGVDSVSLAGHLGPHHAAAIYPLCGFFTDSLVNSNWSSGDSVKAHTGGNLTFFFNCNNGKPNGYTAYDSLATTKTTRYGSSECYVKQYYTIKCLDDNHLFVGVDGDIYFYSLITDLCGCQSISNANYVLSGLKVDLTTKDILSGTATFKAYGKGWFLTGTIVFLGNHMADVTINGKTFRINVLTGECNCGVR